MKEKNKMNIYKSGNMLVSGIPKDIVDKLKLRPGDKFTYSIVNNSTLRIDITHVPPNTKIKEDTK